MRLFSLGLGTQIIFSVLGLDKYTGVISRFARVVKLEELKTAEREQLETLKESMAKERYNNFNYDKNEQEFILESRNLVLRLDKGQLENVINMAIDKIDGILDQCEKDVRLLDDEFAEVANRNRPEYITGCGIPKTD